MQEDGDQIMPMGDNNNQNQQAGTKADGDILAQLAANQATVKDVFILEKGMSASLNKIVKNQDKTNTVLSDIQKATRTNSKVISSVDGELQNLLRKIDSIVNDVHTIGTTALDNTVVSNSIDNHLTTVIDKLDDISASISGINVTPDLNIDFSDIIGKLDTIIANQTLSQNASTGTGSAPMPTVPDYSTQLNDIIQYLNNLGNTTTPVDYSTQLNSIDQQLSDFITNNIPIDYRAQLNSINQQLNNIAGNANNYNTGTTDSTTDLLDILNRLLPIVDQMGIDVMDTKSYVNDCSSYLDEIRELLRNIDDNTSNGNTLNPNNGSTTQADTLEELNNTILDVLQEIQNFHYDVNDHSWQNELDLAEIISILSAADLDNLIPTMAALAASSKGAGKRRSTTGTSDTDDDDDERKDKGVMSAAMNDMTDLLKTWLGDAFGSISTDTVSKILKMLDGWGSGKFITGDVISGLGAVAGDVVGGTVSTALNAFLPGVGSIIGAAIDKAITKGFEAVGTYVTWFAQHARDTRDALIKAALDKIKQDVKDMATYSVDIQRTSLDKIYNVWDQNLSTVNATQGYTKEALNSLQDSVAQRLQREGYGNVINAADYITQLTNTLNSKLGGELAEAFAAQNLILQKAVPELDLSAMAADFAAIYTNAEKQGRSGEAEMINAMNQIAGATKALEEVTGGNNQFITQVGTFLKKAEEVVIRSGGTTDQIIELTTQMMAAEAPLAALTPQLGGFTNTIIDALMNSNESTAVALRAITHDINNTIGVSMTDFTNSFMQDTQGTLTAVYQAIDTFINTNANESARQEFLQAMQSVFGLQASQIAQIDFGDIADQIASASLTTNAKALTAAENLVRSGETTTWEDQLVNNTTNQLLATNAVRDTIDNKLMRKLETNELEMERAVYALEATQTVDFAEKTMAFLTNIADIITGLLDPLGLLSGLTTIADVWNSAEIDKASYELVTTASSIGSTVTTAVDDLNADLRTHANTWGNAQNLAVQAMTKTSTDMMGVLSPAAMLAQSITGTGVNQGQAEAAVNILQNSGVTDTFDELMTKHTETTINAEQAIAEAQAAEMHNQSMELQAQRMQQAAARERQEKAEANQTAFDTRRMEALQQQRAQQAAEAAMVTANHDNIEAIRESVSKLDELSNYLSPILDENRNQSGLLQSLADKVDQLVHTLTNRASQPTVTSPTPNVNTSYNERDRIYGPVKVW